MRGEKPLVHLVEVLDMNKIINIGNKESAIKVIKQIKEKDYVPFDLKITNSHIMSLNEKIGFVVFRKDSLYINSHSLWELMQPLGDKGSHNHHELTEEDIYIALTSIKEPYAILDACDNKNSKTRYSIISIKLSHFKDPFMIVIEVGAELRNVINANINKVVTIYPMSDYDDYVKNYDIKGVLYCKQ